MFKTFSVVVALIVTSMLVIPTVSLADVHHSTQVATAA
jgi:hypothetical protein